MPKHALTIAVLVSVIAGCSPTASPGPSASNGAPPSGSASSPSAAIQDSVTLVDFASANDPAGAAKRETELTRELREEAGMAALIGPAGGAAFDELDTLEAGYATALMAEVAAAIDAGGLPQGDRLPTRLLASTGALEPRPRPQADTIDISIFADTGFTASALMTLYAGVVSQAASSGSGSLPRQESFDQDSKGLHQHVDLATTFTVTTGGGHVSADIIMSATARITDAASGSFVALYTSRTTGHFDVNACPDGGGVAEGTYTFDTKHELNDVSAPDAVRSGSGRATDAPFRLINGSDAHLVQIEAAMDMKADAFGPGSPGGPGPTAPFNWNANQQVQVVMPASGSTTATGSGLSVAGTGSAGASGAMFLSSAMAQLFLAEVAKEAEKFWRSGECIELKTSEESRDVTPQETVEFDASSVGKFDGEEIDAPIKGTFSGVKSLEPADQPLDPPAHFTFVAGDESDDKGTIQLEQVGVRGIGKKTLDFKVGVKDYRVNGSGAAVGGDFTGTKCDGIGGAWLLTWSGNETGTTTFTLPDDGSSSPAYTELHIASPDTTYKLNGTASVSSAPDGSKILTLTLGSGTVTIVVPKAKTTQPFSVPGAVPNPLEEGDFCK